SAGPVVAGRKLQDGVVLVEFDVDDGGARVLGGVGQRFRDDVVGRDLDSPWQPALGVQVELDRYRRAAAQRSQRRFQAPFGEDRGVEPVGDLSQFAENARQPFGRVR